MSTTDHYIQFPLCALAIVDEPTNVVGLILAHAANRIGFSMFNALPDEKQEAIHVVHGPAEDVGWSKWVQEQGARKCGFTLNGGDFQKNYYQLQSHLKDWESRHGKDAQVRVKTDVCLDVFERCGMSFREFRVLCAIYSAIGDSAYRRITSEMIRARASGCKSPAVMETEEVTGRPLPKALTIKQVRTTVDDLHERGWFARVTPNPHGRATYYSHRMSADALRERLFDRITYSSEFRAEQRKEDVALHARIRKAKAAFALPANLPGQPVPAKGHVNGSAVAPRGHLQ